VGMESVGWCSVVSWVRPLAFPWMTGRTFALEIRLSRDEVVRGKFKDLLTVASTPRHPAIATPSPLLAPET